jgi:hypothetical protein
MSTTGMVAASFVETFWRSTSTSTVVSAVASRRTVPMAPGR